MYVAARGLAVLVGGAAVAVAMSTNALAAPPNPASTGVKTVDSCSQNIAPGHYACFAMRRSDLGYTPKTVQVTPGGYGPASLQSAYKLPSATAGAGQRVYVIDAYDDPNAAADLNTYRAKYALPACTTASGCFQKLNQRGQTSPLPARDAGWAGEISLDLDMVSAACPKCGITLIEADDASDNLFIAVQEATTLGAKFVSMSWGGPEDGTESTYDSKYFKSSGVVYTASTGDGAYLAGVSYPATSPVVVAVGGTRLSTSTNSRGWTESVWRTSTTDGTGSGCSGYAAKPSWQSIIATSTCGKRADSDVSAVADPATGVAVYQSYGGSGWAVYGGTSAAAPIIASVYALAGVPGAAVKPPSDPYAHAGNLFDVTSGNNGTCTKALLCTSAAGWDGPTGLGTPNGTAAFTAAGPPGNTVTVTNPGSETGKVGTAASLQIHATSSAAGTTFAYSATALPPGLSISAATGLISGKPSAAGTFSVSTSARDATGASGSAPFTWTIATPGGRCTGQLLKNPGFESGATSWAVSKGVINTGGEHAHAGSGYAWLDGYGKTHTDTLSQSVTIPAGCHAKLSYYLWISSLEGTKTAHDTVKVTAGAATMRTLSNANQGTAYVLRSIDLSSFAGKTVALKWTATENSSLPTSFVVDDTGVTLS